MKTIILAALSCAMLQTPDDQAYCRAIEANNEALCQSIRSKVKRTECRVTLGADTSNCNALSSIDREQCRMLGAIRQPNK